jgi:hypothetical protein
MTAARPPRLSKLANAVAAVAVFGLVGPPAGGVVAWALMGSRSGQSPYPFLAGSFAEGLVLALGTGLLVVGAAWIAGRTSWLAAVAAAVLANVVFFVATGPNPSVDLALAAARSAFALLIPSLVAALVCWLLTRRLLLALQS